MTLEDAVRARDRVLDEWLLQCNDQERVLTAWWLLDGSNAQMIPTRLIRAQTELMEMLTGPREAEGPNP